MPIKLRTKKRRRNILMCCSLKFNEKRGRLQTHKKQYELIQIEDKVSLSDFFTRISKLVNLMKQCGETLANQGMLEKKLRYLSPIFDHIVVVVVIEESKDLNSMTIDHLQGSLEARAQRMNERGAEKA